MVYNSGEDAVACLLAKENELSRKLIITPITEHRFYNRILRYKLVEYLTV